MPRTPAVEQTLKRCDFLQKFGLWPRSPTIRPRGWINNFGTNHDELIAATILERLLVFSTAAVDAFFVKSYRDLLDDLLPNNRSIEKLSTKLANLILTPVQKETPDPTASGFDFCRKARTLLGIGQNESIKFPSDALYGIIKNEEGILVFVDDFLGSGNQLRETWRRRLLSDGPQSFEQACLKTPFQCYYTCIFATRKGMDSVSDMPIVVVPCHVLDDEHTVHSIDHISGLNTADPQGAIKEFLYRHSQHLMFTGSAAWMTEQATWSMYGFNDLGLLLAFEHSIPDGTLPILWARSTRGNWHPFMEKR